MSPEVLFKITFILPSNSDGDIKDSQNVYLVIGDGDEPSKALDKAMYQYQEDNRESYWSNIQIEVIEGRIIK